MDLHAAARELRAVHTAVDPRLRPHRQRCKSKSRPVPAGGSDQSVAGFISGGIFFVELGAAARVARETAGSPFFGLARSSAILPRLARHVRSGLRAHHVFCVEGSRPCTGDGISFPRYVRCGTGSRRPGFDGPRNIGCRRDHRLQTGPAVNRSCACFYLAFALG